MTEFKYEGRDLEAMSFARRYHEWILSLFRPFLGERVAEVGAGSGNFSALLLREPIRQLVAIEPSTEMFERLTEATASDTRVERQNDFFSEVSEAYPSYFDSIVYVNVLEHVERDAEELTHVHQALRPGGHACIFVPALPWLYSEHDASIGHFRRYTRRELLTRMKGAGFEIVRTRYFDIAGILPWLILMKILRKKPAAGSVSIYDTFIVPVSRVLESLVPPPIGKNLVVVGRKPLL